MRIHIQFVRLAVLAIVSLTMTACAEITITSPNATRRNLTTPFDLVVEHSGCGQPLPEITAWLDKGTANEKEIGSAFVFDGGHKWIASDYSLPLGTHTLEVAPNVNWGNPLACNGYKADTKREFIVHESTCIKGKAYYQPYHDGSPVPYAGHVAVTVVDGGEVVATGETDANSDFCLDGIPVGHFFNVAFWGAEDPQLENVDAGVTPHNCANQDCLDICEYSPELCEAGCFIAKAPPEW